MPLLTLLAAVLIWFLGPIGRLLVAGAVVLFVPGFLLWAILGGSMKLPRLAAPALWLCLSLSLIPILFLWSSTLGLRLTSQVLRFQAVGVTLLAVWVWLRAPGSRVSSWLYAAWAIVLGLVVLTRLLEIRAVNVPLWVDSVHHTLLVRIVGETGQIPRSLEPYLPVPDLIYHWGYHTVVATWRAIANTPLAWSVLWTGQFLNAAIALVLYALGAYILRSPRAGLMTAIVGGLLSLMPAYYVTWGRYTQLTGLLILPGLIIASIALAERPAFSWRLVCMAATLMAGLMLVHYRVLVFYVAFMLAYMALFFVQRPRQAGSLILRFLAAGSLTALITLPWLIVLLRQILIPVAQAPGALVGNEGYNSIDRSLLFAGNARILYILAACSLVLAIRQWRVVAMAGWIGMMFLIANPQVLGVPSSWLINNHSVTITLFMPVAVLIAAGFHQVMRWLERLIPSARNVAGRSIIAGLLLGVALFGTWQLRNVINQQTILALPEDMQAIEWAATNTPQDARFLVNTTPWLNGAYRGADAGWWLLPLAGRWVATPPALYIYGSPAYKQAVETLNQQIAALKPGDEAQLMSIIRAERITHIFVGKQPAAPFRADVLLSNPAFTPIYNQDGVVIFAVRSIP